MPTANFSRASRWTAGAAAWALAGFGLCGSAQARETISLSVGVSLPGAQVGNMNLYPVYAQPSPMYVRPAPIYAPQPLYYGQPVYAAPQPIYYARPHHRRYRGYYVPAFGFGHRHRPGHAPIYYRR